MGVSASGQLNDSDIWHGRGNVPSNGNVTSALSSGHNVATFRERGRHGVVIAKIISLASSRRAGDRNKTITVTPRGALFYGNPSTANANGVKQHLLSYGYSTPVSEYCLEDGRAHRILIIYTDRWYVVPSQDVFSRHSGTCVVLGDRNTVSQPHKIGLGDCFRLGSVGLVVSEIRLPGKEEQRLDSSMLQYLKDEALAIDLQEDFASLAADEFDLESPQENGPKQTSNSDTSKSDEKYHSTGVGNGERFICYMCYETHDTVEDPLVAPCDCKGDTRYLHVQCLQKFYYSSVSGVHAQVIRTTGNGAPACKICGAAYKTTFKRQNGRTASLLAVENDGPYLSLVVVTKHDTNPGLFNTKFRLNFGEAHNILNESLGNQPQSLLIGRSSACNMILDYRTVSTVHARLFYEGGSFFLQDNHSSNGTMVYLKDPYHLQYSQTVRIRTGRSTLLLQAKRSWTASFQEMISGRNSIFNTQGNSREEDSFLLNSPNTPPSSLQSPTISQTQNPHSSSGGTTREESAPATHNHHASMAAPRFMDRSMAESSIRPTPQELFTLMINTSNVSPSTTSQKGKLSLISEVEASASSSPIARDDDLRADPKTPTNQVSAFHSDSQAPSKTDYEEDCTMLKNVDLKHNISSLKGEGVNRSFVEVRSHEKDEADVAQSKFVLEDIKTGEFDGADVKCDDKMDLSK